MRQLIAAFMDIALHRRSPDSVPASGFLLALLLACHIPLGIAVLYLRGAFSAQGNGFAGEFGFFLGDLALYVAFIFAVLRFFKLEARFLKTLTALLGTEILINAFGLPFGIVERMVGTESADAVVVWAYLALLIWWVDVAGYIFCKALEQPYIVGLMFVILYVMTSLSIYSLLNQPPA